MTNWLMKIMEAKLCRSEARASGILKRWTNMASAQMEAKSTR